MKLFLMLLAIPLAGFSQLNMGICNNYSSQLSSYCAENSCSSVSELESALSSSGVVISSLSAECRAGAYKDMASVLAGLLGEEKDEKEKALALAKKRKNLSAILGVTTGVATAGAIGLGVAYGNEKNKTCETCSTCTNEQLKELAIQGKKLCYFAVKSHLNVGNTLTNGNFPTAISQLDDLWNAKFNTGTLGNCKADFSN